MASRKSGLGKGLDSLFMDNGSIAESKDSTTTLHISELEPNRDQPRKEFDAAALAELADSIAAVGVIQPLIVRPMVGGGYQIVAGERRWRAAQSAGLTEVPVIIRELSDKEVDEIALIENLQREDLNPVEEAEGYRHLMNEYGMTQEQVASRVGKSRPSIANSVRLLELPDSILGMLTAGDLTVGHVRPLLGLHDEDSMVKVACMAVKKKLTVRDVEKQVKKEKGDAAPKKPVTDRDQYFNEVEIALAMALGRKVKVVGTSGKGTLQIDFYSNDDLTDLANLLGGEVDEAAE
ncbi:MAG: ParB/RepB/Spo0J family partition protein [Clostridia bacterium]|nr:ParB/RepB/Spo0J family partition protein [Clostridia bacterium]MBQ4397084.1 ParB/RepB/Spo0J family partition protein [Clostridia bacterium]